MDEAQAVIGTYRALGAENAELRAEVARLRRDAEALRIELAVAHTNERTARDELAGAHRDVELAHAHLDALWSATRSDVRSELIRDVRAELHAELAPTILAEIEAPIRKRMEAERDALVAAAVHKMRLEYDDERARLVARLSTERLEISERAAAQLRELSEAVAARADMKATAREGELYAEVHALIAALRAPLASAPAPVQPASQRRPAAAMRAPPVEAERPPRQRKLLDAIGPRQRAKLRRELLGSEAEAEAEEGAEERSTAEARQGPASAAALDALRATTAASAGDPARAVAKEEGDGSHLHTKSSQGQQFSTAVAEGEGDKSHLTTEVSRGQQLGAAAPPLASAHADGSEQPPAAQGAADARAAPPQPHADPLSSLAVALSHERSVRASLERVIVQQLGAAGRARDAPPFSGALLHAVTADQHAQQGALLGREARGAAAAAWVGSGARRHGQAGMPILDGRAQGQPASPRASAWSAPPPPLPAYRASPATCPSTPHAYSAATSLPAAGGQRRVSFGPLAGDAELGRLAVAAAEQRIAQLSQLAVDAAYGSQPQLEAEDNEGASVRWVTSQPVA